MKKKFLLGVFTLLSALLCLENVYANSSWGWVDKRPFDLLPLVIIITLTIEVLMTINCLDEKKWIVVITVITLANLVSFAAPYIYIQGFGAEVGYTFKECLDNIPTYNVCFIYLLMTVIIELPIVYGILKSYTQNKTKLFKRIILANTITTVLVFIIERIFCSGSY
ncbi:hypothetical protein [Anaerofustis stercorihominis]|uniref:Uncharacterized protein n=1 Tax=Anaerofustis stercorihominis TaxID=214853 RepID=A0A3E3DZD8_9FIRM|nr:hypothetical protein [Anaerofustis stercorihominis]RGD74445.1 hypothetical protein DW687_06670 [Anaerofustis stercorihominis]